MTLHSLHLCTGQRKLQIINYTTLYNIPANADFQYLRNVTQITSNVRVVDMIALYNLQETALNTKYAYLLRTAHRLSQRRK